MKCDQVDYLTRANRSACNNICGTGLVQSRTGSDWEWIQAEHVECRRRMPISSLLDQLVRVGISILRGGRRPLSRNGPWPRQCAPSLDYSRVIMLLKGKYHVERGGSSEIG